MVNSASHLQDMIHFARLMLRLQSVVRAIHLPGREAKENDAEHSYHLAMMGWYLNSGAGLGYNTDKLIRYALAHDLVEAYAGDVSALDLEGRKHKRERESEALSRIESEFPEAADLTQAVRDYESLADEEAKFIYALDKLMPALMVYLDGGRTWHEEGQSLELIQYCQSRRIAVSEPVWALYSQLIEILRERPDLFPADMLSGIHRNPNPRKTSSPRAFQPRKVQSVLSN
jgi:putative hydrolase of HD superfamily